MPQELGEKPVVVNMTSRSWNDLGWSAADRICGSIGNAGKTRNQAALSEGPVLSRRMLRS